MSSGCRIELCISSQEEGQQVVSDTVASTAPHNQSPSPGQQPAETELSDTNLLHAASILIPTPGRLNESPAGIESRRRIGISHPAVGPVPWLPLLMMEKGVD